MHYYAFISIILLLISYINLSISNGLRDYFLITTSILVVIVVIVYFYFARPFEMLKHLIVKNKIITKRQSTLKEKNEISKKFLRTAKNQIKGPLSVISGYSTMMLEGDLDELDGEIKGAMLKINEASYNLEKTLSDLLDANAIESRELILKKSLVDIKTLLLDTAQLFQEEARKKGLKFNISIEGSHPYTYEGDKDKLRQVFINIIDNAFKYTPNGKIDIKLSREGENILISVVDTGIGISEESLKQIFLKFRRQISKDSADTIGSGLGLYIANEIIKLHKSEIKIKSGGINQGTNVVIVLH